jgi:endonuclease/exonuclease/phosphatase family metal-dependent hydrolase
VQGNELLSGPAATDLPVVAIGDFNSRADGSGTPTYANLIAAGFQDAWSAVHPGDPGYTCCFVSGLIDGPPLAGRVDLVLARGRFTALDAQIVGEESDDRTPSGLWPSDHAGVVATLELP